MAVQPARNENSHDLVMPRRANPVVLNLEFERGVQEAGDIIAESPPGNCTARPPSAPSTSYSNARPGLRLPVPPVRPPSRYIPDPV